jgi:hypothetical protein
MDWVVRRNALFFNSLMARAKEIDANDPKAINNRFSFIVVNVTVKTWVDLKKNSKFLKPTNGLNKPMENLYVWKAVIMYG